MSVRHSKGQREDARQKAIIEDRQKRSDAYEAYSRIPAIFYSYIATLAMECDKPTRRTGSDLGVRVTGGDETRRGGMTESQRKAEREIDRLQAWMYREGNLGMGTYVKENAEGQVGRIEQIVYPSTKPPKSETHTPVRGVA